MGKHRNTKARPSKRPFQGFDPGTLISLLYDDLVEVEALAITADECVSSLSSFPSGKYRRTWRGSTRSSARPQAAPVPCLNVARSW